VSWEVVVKSEMGYAGGGAISEGNGLLRAVGMVMKRKARKNL